MKLLVLVLTVYLDFANAQTCTGFTNPGNTDTTISGEILMGSQCIAYRQSRDGVCLTSGKTGPRMYDGQESSGRTLEEEVEQCATACLERKNPEGGSWIDPLRTLPNADLRGFAVVHPQAGGDADGRCYCEMAPTEGQDACTTANGDTVYEGQGNLHYRSYTFECPQNSYLDDGGGSSPVDAQCTPCPPGTTPESFTTAYPLEQCADFNECTLNPCQNGGVCSDSTTDASIPLDSYKCACPNGYDGEFCQNNGCGAGGIQSCLNNGTCFEDAVVLDNYGDDDCFCPSGKRGHRCEKDVSNDPCTAPDKYRGSTILKQSPPNGHAAEYCQKGSPPPGAYDYADQYRPYDGDGDNPGTTYDEKLLNCFRACVDFDNSGYINALPVADAYTDGNYWTNHEWYDSLYLHMVPATGRCYCYTKPITHHTCEPGHTYLTTDSYDGYEIRHTCESGSVCVDDLGQGLCANPTATCLDGLNTRDCDDCDPNPCGSICLDGAGIYSCFTETTKHGVCIDDNSIGPRMYNGYKDTLPGQDNPGGGVTLDEVNECAKACLARQGPKGYQWLNEGSGSTPRSFPDKDLRGFGISTTFNTHSDYGRCFCEMHHIDNCVSRSGTQYDVYKFECPIGQYLDDGGTEGGLVAPYQAICTQCPAGKTTLTTDAVPIEECADINECTSNPCQNGGVCSDSTTDVTIALDTYECTVQPHILDVGSGIDRLFCQSCDGTSDCGTGLACAEPSLTDYEFVREGDCQGQSSQENTDTENFRGTTETVALCANKCKYFGWGAGSTGQPSKGFHWNKNDNSCYCESLDSVQPECGTIGSDTNVRRYDFDGFLDADYEWAHLYECNSANNADDQVSKTVTSIQDCADQCRGAKWNAGGFKYAKGFIYRSVENDGPGCYCEAVHSYPHADCANKGINADWSRYDFKVPFAFMHYGECRGTNCGSGACEAGSSSTLDNTANQDSVGSGLSLSECGAACQGHTWTKSEGFKTAIGFIHHASGSCYCESMYSHPHVDCARATSSDWKRYDFVNYSPVIELKHTWFGSCQLDQVCTEITGDMYENQYADGSRPQLSNDQHPMILVTDNEPTLLFGGIGDPKYFKMIETDFNGNMLNTAYFDTRTISINPNQGTTFVMTLADVTLDMWLNERKVYMANVDPTNCEVTRYCLQDFQNPNGWNQADTGLTYDANVETQCGRVCQGALVGGVGAKGFEIEALACTCKADSAVAGTTCQALEGCKSYDFEIDGGGVYENFGYCHPTTSHELFSSGQSSGTVDDWLENCRAGCVSHTPTASHFTFDPSDGHCYCMQTAGGAQTEHPCLTGSITMNPTVTWKVYTIWDGGVLQYSGCQNKGVDLRGEGVCVPGCTASSIPTVVPGEIHCINGVASVFADACFCACAPGWSGTSCETDTNECAVPNNTVWTQLGNAISGPSFKKHGKAVILNYDGSVVAFGTPNGQSAASPGGYGEGYAGVYRLIGNTWTQMGSNLDGDAEDDLAGSAVALSDNGLTVAVGAPQDGYAGGGCGYGCGSVKIFEYDGSTWIQKGLDIDGASSEFAGSSVALNSDGSRVVLGSPSDQPTDSGDVSVYEFDGSAWQQLGSDIPGSAAEDRAGSSVKMNANGDIIVIGSPTNDDSGNNAGQVRVFEYDGSTWNTKGLYLNGQAPDDRFGSAVCMSSDGGIIAVGAYNHDETVGGNQGTVQVFEWSGSAWVQKGLDLNGLTSPVDSTSHGYSISLSDSGTRLAVGAPFYGSVENGYVKIYEFYGNAWVSLGQEIHPVSDVRLGIDVALSGDGMRLTVGTLQQNEVVTYENANAYSPCLNGASCSETSDGVTPTLDAYFCACPPGYGGTNCEIPLDCVATLNPEDDGLLDTSFYCNNNGTIGGFVGSCNCTCINQFSGTNCDECAPGLGYNVSVDGSHMCEHCPVGLVNNQTSHRAACAPLACDYGFGYTSDIATLDFAFAWDADNTSLNSGNCKRCPPDTESPHGDGQCVLCTTAGMEGLDCLVDTDECAPNNGSAICLNGATCFDSNNYSFVPLTKYICNCTDGWEGTNCEIDINECLNTTDTFPQLCDAIRTDSCNTDDGPNTRNCVCHPGYEGLLCETDIDECLSTNNTNFPQLCNTTGTDSCNTTDGANTRNCNCKAGYEGLLCEIDTDECSPDPCVNGACTETSDGVTLTIDSFHCACIFGWIGTDCGTLEKKLELLASDANIVSWVMVAQGVAVVVFLAVGVRQFTPVQRLARFVRGKPAPKSCCEKFFEWLCARRKSSSVNRAVRYIRV